MPAQLASHRPPSFNSMALCIRLDPLHPVHTPLSPPLPSQRSCQGRATTAVVELAMRIWPETPGLSSAKPSPQQPPGYASGTLGLAISHCGDLGWPAWSCRRCAWPRAVATIAMSSVVPITSARVVSWVVGVVWLASLGEERLGWPA